MTDDESGAEGTEVEETVMLTRRDRRRSREAVEPVESADAAESGESDPAASAESADDLDAATVVVDRRSAAPEGPGADREDDPADDSTVLVARTPRRVRRGRSASSEEQGEGSVGRTAAAVPVSFEAPTDAPAPEIYRPRPAPLGPSAPPVVIGAAAPTRTVDPGLRSVAKQGLRWSRATLVAVAAACVVSVAGLVGLGFVVFA